MKKILIFILVLILFTGCTNKNIFNEQYESMNNQINEKNNKKYREVKLEDNNIKIISLTEAVDVIKNETAVIYFGFNTCPWCRSMVENFVKVTNELNIEKVYYVDVKTTRDVYEVKEGKIVKTKDAGEGYDEVVELLKDHLSNYTLTDSDGSEVKNDMKRIYAPNVVVVKDGNVLGLIAGSPKDLKDPYGEITKEMNDESYNSLKDLIKKIKAVDTCDGKEGC